jgi:RNA polymerase sigma-70 factor (ECF subfamily)
MNPGAPLAATLDAQLRDIHALGRAAATRAQALERCRRLAAQHPEPEVLGLLALLLLHARDRARIDEALRLVDRALGAREVGTFTLRAAIAALHAQARSAGAPDWRRVASLYELLAEIDDSPEVARDLALARARCNGSPRHGSEDTRCF